MDYLKVTEEQTEEIWKEAEKWRKTAPMAWIFNDVMSTAKKAIAEYIANQRGLSLWKTNLHHPGSARKSI